MSAALAAVVAALDEELQVGELPDYPGALNGLQLENNGQVSRVACAVDACLAVVERALAGGCDLLVVHHGMFWGGLRAWRGGYYRKLAAAVRGNLAIYSAHLPLDVHPELGNNIRLARALGLTDPEPFFAWQGIPIGLCGKMDLTRNELLDRLAVATGARPHLAPGGPEQVHRVGLVTGGAGGEIRAAAAYGIDTFITGEGPHWSFTDAEEAGVNLVYGGHYATETFGVRALGEWLAGRFGLPWEFVDHPSGL
jgi:dinuclear metal center YbgI/SA1388 family protein